MVPSLHPLVPALDSSHRTRKQIEACSQWLFFCLSIGWKKSELDALQRLWWEFHDDARPTIDRSE
jgi:hypothetical protein